MSRKHVAAGRADRFKALLREVTEAAQLPSNPANKLRLEAAAWTALAMENTRTSILSGAVVPVDELEKFATVLNSVLPPATTLTVNFVDTYWCAKCKAELPLPPPKAAPEPVKSELPEPQPPTAPAPATSVNVVAPHKDIHAGAPLARHDEPWRSPIGTEFRRFDIPENF